MKYKFICKEEDLEVVMSCDYDKKDDIIEFFANFLRAAGFIVGDLYEEDVQTDQ